MTWEDPHFDPPGLVLYVDVVWDGAPEKVELVVFIDDEPEFSGRFPVRKGGKRDQYRWVQLAEGDHRLLALVRGSKKEFRQEFQLIGRRLYARLLYTHSKTKPGFEWDIRNKDFDPS